MMVLGSALPQSFILFLSLFDFGAGNVITLNGVSSLTGLEADFLTF